MHLRGQTTTFQTRLEISEDSAAGLNDTQIAKAVGCSVWTVRKWRRRSIQQGRVGFTSQMDQYMAAADLMIGKAGGLTTSEALARHLPMALIEPIPGQEFRNADHLLEGGAAIRCNNLPAAAWKIAKLIDDAPRMSKMRQSAATMAHPTAAAQIAEDALRLLH